MQSILKTRKPLTLSYDRSNGTTSRHCTNILSTLFGPKKQSKRLNIDHFPMSHGSLFTRHFVYLSERNSAANTFVQCHEVPLGLSQDIVDVFLVSNPDFISARAQKGLNWPILRSLTDRHLRGVSTTSRDETALKACFHNANMCPQGYHRTELLYFMFPGIDLNSTRA